MKQKPFYLAVRGILENAQGQVLLMQRAANSKNQPNFWEYPGGKVDAGEDFETALIREFEEETGLEVQIDSVLGAGQWKREHYSVAYLYLKVVEVGGTFQMSDEHDDYAWMSSAEHLKAQISPQLENIRQKYLKIS